MFDANSGTPPTAAVAVVGMGCRLAGDVDSPDSFWALLRDGRDGIGELPEQRWDHYRELGPEFAAALRRATRHGAFLRDVEGFDAEFFGVTPREAELMDPQQRILLEVTWNALEHAGIPARRLAGGDTGVFVGVGSDDYGRRLLEDLPRIEAWTGIGAAMCAVANRISYALDLRGPSLAVDTACSASLVAVHLACQSLRTGESSLAIAAGVNLILAPGLTLTLDAAGATSPDGRCKSFDAAADGYGRGEGCGVLVLKRLADAERDGDRVLAVIRGSAVQQDGRTNGIMAPSRKAQEQLLVRACRQAGVAPTSVDYVEAHGTGTRLGDPLEAGALGAVYGAGRQPGEPCLIGSVKASIGHLEAAAGVASLIKAILALRHAEIPRSLNLETPNPAIDWTNAGLRVVTEHQPWPHRPGPRRAGVSGFGYGGTIAHVLLEQAPDPRPAPDGPAGLLFPLSAGSPEMLRRHAGDLVELLAAAELSPADLGHTLSRRRAQLEHRAAVVAADRSELVARLRHVARGEQAQHVATGRALPGAGEQGPRPVWVFSGHGSQWSGMGQGLLADEPAFAAVMDELAPVFQAEIGFTPREVLSSGDLGAVDRIQTMIFATQVGLAAVWRAYGVNPAAVIGHSVGEIAAAVACGGLSLADGARLSCRRSILLRRVAGAGAMAMAAIPFAEAERRLAGRTDVVAAIAASPASTVIAGDPDAVAEVRDRWQAEGVLVRRVNSDVAFHSPQMDPLCLDLAAALGDLSPAAPVVPMYRTSLTDPRGAAPLDGAYWAGNLRNPVRLGDAVAAAAEDGHRAFVEISAHPVVAHSIGETLADLDRTFVGSTLRRNYPERATFLTNLGAAHCHGVPVDWARLQPAGTLVDLPLTPWQHRRHWRDAPSGGPGGGMGHDPDSHTLVGTPVSVAGAALGLWRTRLDDESRPYPGHHTIHGTEVVPAAVLLNTFLRAGADQGRPPVLTDVALRVALPTADPREIQVVAEDDAVRLASRTAAGDDAAWQVHASAALRPAPAPAPAHPAAPADATGPGDTTGPGDGTGPGDAAGWPGELTPGEPSLVTDHLAAVGVPSMAFSWQVRELAQGDGVLRALVRVDQPAPAATWAPVLDAALSAAPAAFGGPPVLRVVAGVDTVTISGAPPAEARIDVRVDDDAPDRADVTVADPAGTVLARLRGVRFGVLDGPVTAPVRPEHLVYEIGWTPYPAPAEQRTPREVVLVGGAGPLAEAITARITGAGVPLRAVADAAGLARLAPAPDPSGVVLVLPGGDADVPAAAARQAWLLTEVAQVLAAGDGSAFPRLWAVTRAVRESADPAALADAPLWGLGRVLATEHPELWGGLIDLDPADEGGLDALPGLLGADTPDDVLAPRGTGTSVARLAPLDRPAVRPPLRCRPDGTYLVTGGLGTLGLAVADWLADQGARRLVLAGRAGLPPRARWDRPADDGGPDPATRDRIARVRALEARGVTVRVLAVDVADADALRPLLDPDALGLPPVRGVVHLAGVLDNRFAANLDEDSLRRVLRPKVDGAWALHRLFPPGSVDFLTLFSSCGQLLGLPGQASYGAANAFLDALATHRRTLGADDTTSFGWTSWQGQGMAVNAVVDNELKARAVAAIEPEQAFAAWQHAHRHGGGHLPVLRVLPAGPATDRPPLLAQLPSGADAGDGAAEQSAAVRLADLPPEELRATVQTEVGTQIAAEMRLPLSELDLRRSLLEQGLDSVMTLVIRRRLEKRFGRPVPATLLWNQPTVSAIAEHLVDALTAAPAGAEP
ncbi:type I polyketide synthase [Micromonospora sp. NPDC050495]|uniref:type I polyketide synthase n=1 Tax=Micromonospora sp. NPDC050495 TaxID=3154936 RepID=UPI0033CD66B4